MLINVSQEEVSVSVRTDPFVFTRAYAEVYGQKSRSGNDAFVKNKHFGVMFGHFFPEIGAHQFVSLLVAIRCLVQSQETFTFEPNFESPKGWSELVTAKVEELRKLKEHANIFA